MQEQGQKRVHQKPPWEYEYIEGPAVMRVEWLQVLAVIEK